MGHLPVGYPVNFGSCYRSPLGVEIVSNYPGDKIFNWSKTDSFEFPKKDFTELDDDPSVQQHMVTIDTTDLIVGSFLKDSEEDGQRFQARVICAFIENLDRCKKDPRYKKFVCKMYKFQGITVHQNSQYTVSMKRKTGETAYESFVTCTQYAKQHGLLDTDGYKEFQCITIDSPNI
jgi:hypothetical protein